MKTNKTQTDKQQKKKYEENVIYTGQRVKQSEAQWRNKINDKQNHK